MRNTWYPYVRAVHVGGAGVLFGSLLLFDLRMLGRGNHLDVHAVHRLTMGAIWIGFSAAVVAGCLLFTAQPQALWENTALRMKLLLIVLAGVNALAFEWTYHRNRSARMLRAQAALSLAIWAAVLVFSALIPYWGF